MESSLPESAFSAPILSFVSCTLLDTEMPPRCMQLCLVMPFRDSRRKKAGAPAVCVEPRCFNQRIILFASKRAAFHLALEQPFLFSWLDSLSSILAPHKKEESDNPLVLVMAGGGCTGPRVDPPAHGLDVQLRKASDRGLLLRTPVQESIFQGEAVIRPGRLFAVWTFHFFQEQCNSIRDKYLARLASCGLLLLVRAEGPL